MSGLALDILKVESWTQMGRTANIIIKYSIQKHAYFADGTALSRALNVNTMYMFMFPLNNLARKELKLLWDHLIFIFGHSITGKKGLHIETYVLE